jgi:prepilin-type N-terminal cleavage/methylation domain-containing protein
MPKAGNKRRSSRGLTLIEVLLAVALMSLGLVVMLTAITRCLKVLKVSTSYHKAMWALSAGEAEYPLILVQDGDDMEPEDFEVSTEEFGGVVFERTVEDPDEDLEDNEVRLLVVKTKLAWASGGKENTDEIVRYIVYHDK